jgi:hypothetical protein
MKINLAKINPIITVNAEFAKLLLEYFADISEIMRLIIKPIIPEISRFLFRDNVLLYFIHNLVKKSVSLQNDFIFT